MPQMILDFGYDPTVVESGRTIRPVFTGALPPSATVNPQYLPPPRAQGTSAHEGSPPTCAAWASTYGLATYTAAAASGRSPLDATLQASPAHIYCQVMQLYQPKTKNCVGSQLATYLNFLQGAGTPNWSTAPYSPSCAELWSSYDPNAPLDPSFQIPGWAMISTSDLEAVKAVIANGGVLCYGTALNSGFMTYDGTPSPMNGPFDKVTNPDGSLVGHCMLIIGYDDTQNAVLIQNSFGPEWGCEWNGSGGYVWMSYELFQYLSQGQAMYVTP